MSAPLRPTPPASFADPAALRARLAAARQELLDLSLRNPLLNFRPSRVRGVTVVGEKSAAVLQLLTQRLRALSFAPLPPAPGAAPVGWKAAPTEPVSLAEQAAARRHGRPLPESAEPGPDTVPVDINGVSVPVDPLDGRLQTAEPAAALERRLLNTYYTARTSLEEQGVGILYLALGRLRWYETSSSPEPRYAPLLLLPVGLERNGAAERFRLRWTGGEVEANLSLQARLLADFGLNLPLPAEPDDDPTAYYAAVQQAVAGQPRWLIEPDHIELGFFSFTKLRLYHDLNPAAWPADALLTHPAIQALLGPEAGFQDPAPSLDDSTFLDAEPAAHQLHQVLDADSSQLLALLAVREGRNLVIQGPPGTGKSQTITNLLAEAIGAGKRVLFVAEKMAALDVVKRRLDALGLGAACLELHSHKANKKALLEELRTTLSLGRPAPAPTDEQVAQLPRYRQQLNDYALAVNAPLGRSRRTAQQVAGELLQLREQLGPVELPRIPFAQLAEWTDAEAARAEDVAARLQATLRKIGLPRELLFWGSELTVLLPAEQNALALHLREAAAAVAALQAAAAALAAPLRQPPPPDRQAAEALLPAARHLQLAPSLVGVDVAGGAWSVQAAQLQEVLAAGPEYNRLHAEYDAVLLPEAWAEPLGPERAALLSYGTKWWRFLSGDYRRARRRLQSLWRAPLPDDNAPLVAALDAVQEAARHAQTVQQAGAWAAALFGPAWQGLRSDWPALRRVADYLTLTHQRIAHHQLPASLLTVLAEAASGTTAPSRSTTIVADVEPAAQSLPAKLLTLEAALARHRAALESVVEALQLNETRRFGPEGRLQLQPFARQLSALEAWAANLPALHPAVEWGNAAAAAQAEGLPELLLLAESWPEAARHLTAATRQTWLEYLQRLAFEQHPALRQFERAAHEETLARFRAADQAALLHHRIRALRQHHEQLPHLQAAGQMLVLRHELAKKTRHLAPRRLMEQAGRAVQAIKPVLMMSPLSVASFLPPGAVEFDLVVFDEASQVKPVDALGAIARGRQLVVVGDSKQLPPSSFFDALTGGGEQDEPDEENVTADIPSILELCKARQMPERMLRWHYRSRHHALIAPSNHLYYHDQLVVFPSPGRPVGAGPLGLAYHHLPDAYYERGSTRTNPLEARAVAEAVLQHARATPRLTLGVVAFSMAQRQAIEDALEPLRRQHPDTEAFFARHAHEPFFVKNLENVQGDERDVILISIGYGRTREGRLSMSFGPLNGAGGERRLNVLISRARQRCEVFTNLTADDLDLSRSRAQGVADLKIFLYFAQHGRLRPDEPAGPNLPDGPFEDAVYRALSARGYELHPRLGSQGFHLDLAVVDPAQSGRYLLGIVCDGAMYQAARSARDRDRLRQQQLEAVGWRLHRIWSVDWLRDPAAATERAVQAIEQARRPTPEPPAEEPGPAVAASAVVVDVEREAAAAPAASRAEPYQLAQLPAAVAHRELHQHSLGQLANWLAQVVRIESPIHVDEATRRLAQASGATQVGARMRKTGRAAAQLAANLRHLRQQGDFLWENTMQQPPLRDRSQLPAISRKLALVAPEELARALRTVVADSFALPREAAYLATVRLLGFSRLSDDMRQQLDEILAGLLAGEELAEAAGLLRPVLGG
ncbi:DUF3320 domain-containing protein [Hymenobacter gummosus]|uniref:DUF3320 domain-containing protein n=1 Tax=Hymenobacter gummosus TaxID=1776032 RepID=A0A431TYW5_9BACT|nr:DUF3320 domain-containing protein [Hymenobacter gummosus]RTQ47547.1 DUF3320 domain-containing protein [Hymenobacter gummosus]